MWLALSKDRVWKIFLALMVFLNLPYVLSNLGWEGFVWLGSAIDPLSVTVLLVTLLYGVRTMESEAERFFWYLTAFGYACWWLSEFWVWLFPAVRGNLGGHLAVDGLYVLLFLASLTAAELRPDLGPTIRENRSPRPLIETAGLLIALLALVFYFVLIPSAIDPGHYAKWISSLMLYAALDLLLAVRFFQLGRDASTRRWRVLYRLVCLTMLIWFALDASDAMVRAGWFTRDPLSPANLFWSLPLLTLGAAACLRRHEFVEDPSPKPEPEHEKMGGLLRTGSPIVVVAILLPLMHNTLSALGILLEPFQVARNWLVVVSMVALGSLLLLENRLERRRNRLLSQRQRQNAAVDLRRSEERFRTLADATFEGVIIHDGHKILDANEQLARIFGFPLKYVIGAAIGDRVAATDKERVRERLRQGVADEPIEFKAFRSGRETFIAELRSRDLPSLGKDIKVAVLRDITEYRRLAKDLRQAQKMDAIGRLAGGIAHDFNNLLTVILGGCDLVTAETVDTDVEQIRQAARRAATMTEQLLAFSRQQELEMEILDLNEVVQETLPLLARLLPANIELEVVLAEDLGHLEADRSQMAQVLLNLAINGRDAMPDGGRLRVETGRLRFPPPMPHAAESLRSRVGEVDLGPPVQIVLSVSDEGAGISPDDQNKIFDPFFTTKEKGKGTGLGLATVQGIARQAGGYVEVESTVGEGSTFRVLLPESFAERIAVPVKDAASLEGRWGSGKILVVEDQPEVHQIVEHFLSAVGFEVIGVKGGLEAFEVAESLAEPVRLVIVDVVLPNVGGPEVVQKLRRRWPGLPAFFTSGYSEGPLIEAVKGEPLLAKPFDRASLLRMVQEVLEIHARE